LLNSVAFASCRHRCSEYVRLVGTEQSQYETKFPNCNEHALITETRVNFYSNGSTREYKSHTIINADGTVIISDCSDVKHIIYNKKHYFIAKCGPEYRVLNSDGEYILMRGFKKMEEIAPNRLLVMYEKKYGIIDLNVDTIVPIKYSSFEQIDNNLFITKLNGYYGILDISNNIKIKNEYDSIKPLYDTFLLKKEGKYGLCDLKGNILYEAKYDKIKKLGEYILVKNDKKYFVLDSSGKRLCEKEYRKIRLERNQLQGQEEGKWENI